MEPLRIGDNCSGSKFFEFLRGDDSDEDEEERSRELLRYA